MSWHAFVQINEMKHKRFVKAFETARTKCGIETVDDAAELQKKKLAAMQADPSEKNKRLAQWAYNVYMGSRVVLEGKRFRV